MQKHLKGVLLRILYVLTVCALAVIILEMAARLLGLGDPILYYNAAWGGSRPLPNQQVERLKGATVTIDGNGFRTAVAEVQGALKILYLGDSVTWGGSSVDDTMLFTEIAADALRERGLGVYAMNAGVNGSSLMNQADIYLPMQDAVDVLVWVFPWADVKRAYATVGYLWPPAKKPRFALVEAMDQVIRVYWLSSFRSGGQRAREDFVHPETPYGYEAFFEDVLRERYRRNRDAVVQGVSQALGRGTPVLVGLTPERAGARLLPPPPEALELLRDLEARGARIVDLHGLLEAGGDVEAIYIDNVHFNPEGHRRIGEALGTELMAILRDSTALPDPRSDRPR